MRIDVLIEYDEKHFEIIISSIVAQFAQTRPSWLGLSRHITDESKFEKIEFVGENWNLVKTLKSLWEIEPIKEDRFFRLVNPFSSSTFEPETAYRVINHFSLLTLAQIYPKSWNFRCRIPWIDSYEITLKIPSYSFFEPLKKEYFEKLIRDKYKQVKFI